MNLQALNEVAEAMVAPGKGILAADEAPAPSRSASTSIKTESTADNRRDYREMLFRSTEAMKTTSPASSSTTRPSARRPRTARRWPSVIEAAGALPGIKVDAGAKPLPVLSRAR